MTRIALDLIATFTSSGLEVVHQSYIAVTHLSVIYMRNMHAKYTSYYIFSYGALFSCYLS